MAHPLSAEQLLRALRNEGVKVVEFRNWRGRQCDQPGPFGPVQGVMIHHTATKGMLSTVELCYSGGPQTPGPRCHGVIAKDGGVYMVGGGRAAHAGAGDGDVLSAVVAGRTLPGGAGSGTDADGDRHFYGFAAINLGDGKDPWPEKQIEAIVRVSAALCRAHGWEWREDPSVIGHLEWQPGSTAPRGPGMAMGEVRRRVAERLGRPAPWTPGDDDVALSDEDIDKIARRVTEMSVSRTANAVWKHRVPKLASGEEWSTAAQVRAGHLVAERVNKAVLELGQQVSELAEQVAQLRDRLDGRERPGGGEG